MILFDRREIAIRTCPDGVQSYKHGFHPTLRISLNACIRPTVIRLV